MLSALKRLHPEVKTRRGILNKYYEVKAYKVIREMDDVSFIFNPDKNNETYKACILMELGKFENEADIRTVASHICKRAKSEKLTTHRWANVVRTIRYIGELI
jgi:hypothetical protein